jgi:Tol biopolymer transport system component
MRALPPKMVQVLAPFVPLFSKRCFKHAQVLLMGAILAPGRRTVSSALRAMGLDQHKRFHRYHRVLSRASWSSLEASRVLLGVLVEAFVPEGGPLLVGIDETLERRYGKKISARGVYRDPVRSTHEQFVKSSGLRWVCVMHGRHRGISPNASGKQEGSANMVVLKNKALLSITLAVLMGAGVLVAAVDPAEAAFPGRNGEIAYVHDGSIWTMKPDGTAKTELVGNNNTNPEVDPAVSPDGTQIAYTYGNQEIWVMDIDGNNPRKLSAPPLRQGRYGQPAWSPDGQKIAFVGPSIGPDTDIWAMNADGSGGLANLTNTPHNQERNPAWSPDGLKIVYTRTGCERANAGGTCVYTMSAHGGSQTNLTPEPQIPQCPNQPGYRHSGTSSEPAWSPDGTKIVFVGTVVCPNSRGSDIWVMDRDGANKENLTNDEGTGEVHPAFSPDGTRIAFQSNRDDVWSDIHTMNADGTNQRNITNVPRHFDEDPDWGPTASPPPDPTAPIVIGTLPAANATGVAPAANITAKFSEKMMASSINATTLKLFEKGSITKLDAVVSYSAATAKATLNPTNSLQSGATYRAVVTTGAKDLAGNSLDQNSTTPGLQKYKWFFTVS